MKKFVIAIIVIIGIICVGLLIHNHIEHRNLEQVEYSQEYHPTNYNHQYSYSDYHHHESFGNSLAKTFVRSATRSAGSYVGYHIAKGIHSRLSNHRSHREYSPSFSHDHIHHSRRY